MHVTVGPFPYTVQLVHGPIRHEGQTCYGLCDNLHHQILISDLPNEQQRLQVFFHELMHAWWYHFGEQLDNEEATVDLIGLAMTGFTTQLIAYLRGATDGARRDGAGAMIAHHRPAATCVSPPLNRNDARRAAAPPASVRLTERAESGWTIRLYDPVA